MLSKTNSILCVNCPKLNWFYQLCKRTYPYCSVDAVVNLHRRHCLIWAGLCSSLSSSLIVHHRSLGQGLPSLNAKNPPCCLNVAITENIFSIIILEINSPEPSGSEMGGAVTLLHKH